MSNDPTNGYAEVNGLRMYYKRHGDGPPLVLLHGAFGTIESCFAGLLPELARYGRQETLMTMVHRGFPSAELRDEHRAGLPNAFARLEQAIEERASPMRQADSS